MTITHTDAPGFCARFWEAQGLLQAFRGLRPVSKAAVRHAGAVVLPPTRVRVAGAEPAVGLAEKRVDLHHLREMVQKSANGAGHVSSRNGET